MACRYYALSAERGDAQTIPVGQACKVFGPDETILVAKLAQRFDELAHSLVKSVYKLREYSAEDVRGIRGANLNHVLGEE